MAKRAFCVGINDYQYDESDLKGCVNDAKAWADLLETHFDFDEVNLLLDADATRDNILAGVQDLLDNAQDGDVLVYTFSGHGTYLADTSGDEVTIYEEAQCPYDCEDYLIVDDEWRELFANIPQGVQLTVISDSCFSGSVTRRPPGAPRIQTPDDRRKRFLNPGLIKGNKVLDKEKREKAREALKEKYPESGMNEILLAGCSDEQFSYDALIDGDYHGAMTYFAIKAITEANFDITYADLHKKVVRMISDARFKQSPQLEGKEDNKQRKIFS